VGAGGSTTGLLGEYYDNVNFTGTKVSRIDQTINFTWSGSPDPAIGPDTFSVRWTGQVTPRFSQTYTFTTTSDDGVRLWINGLIIIDNWTDHASTANSGSVALIAGQAYPLRMEFYDNTQAAVAKLSWSSTSQASQIVPASQLSPPIGGGSGGSGGGGPGLPPGNGTGLAATYYDNRDLTGATVTRVDPTVDFNWGAGAPAPTIGADTFSVAWTGFVLPEFSETYSFSTITDDGVRLWVNGILLIDDWTDHASTTDTGAINLVAGQRVPIRMEFYDNTLDAVAHLAWSSTSQTSEIIPQSQLFPQ